MTDFGAFFLGMSAVAVAYIAFTNLTVMVIRICRARNIAQHGWPKPPMDADGDIVWPPCHCNDDDEEEEDKPA